MTRYIDINEIKFTGAVFEDRDGEIYIKLSDVKQSIEQTPTADVVEVVRCKDCKHGHWNQETCHGKCVHYCDLTDLQINKDHFCSYGERKPQNDFKEV